VLAAIITRLRQRHGGKVPAVSRYDPAERLDGPPLPHLFQRFSNQQGRNRVLTLEQIHRLLNLAVARAGITNAAGEPMRFLPHDFRRMFATEAVTGGLPVHIAAKVLGHARLETTQHYLAVFPDERIRAYRAYIDRRRSIRPEAEYREPTEEEWAEFRQHFQERKLELGTCGRPYGTPCRHEHACVRCPMLRVDPKQRARLAEIIRNLDDRITEARMNGWLGEVQGLQTSRDAAVKKVKSLDRAVVLAAQNVAGRAELGMPVPRNPLRR
jgi:Phage integrase family